MEEQLKDIFGEKVSITETNGEFVIESKMRPVLIKATIDARMMRGELPAGKLVQEADQVKYKPYKK